MASTESKATTTTDLPVDTDFSIFCPAAAPDIVRTKGMALVQ
jgi:hypothetical protein